MSLSSCVRDGPQKRQTITSHYANCRDRRDVQVSIRVSPREISVLCEHYAKYVTGNMLGAFGVRMKYPPLAATCCAASTRGDRENRSSPFFYLPPFLFTHVICPPHFHTSLAHKGRVSVEQLKRLLLLYASDHGTLRKR